MKQTLGRQVVSTVPVKHILLLQCWPQAVAGPCTLGYTNVVAKTAATVRKCAFFPNCWGTGGVEGWGGNGHLLEAYSTKPTCKPQRT